MHEWLIPAPDRGFWTGVGVGVGEGAGVRGDAGGGGRVGVVCLSHDVVVRYRWPGKLPVVKAVVRHFPILTFKHLHKGPRDTRTKWAP